ncbi:MAG: glycosyltransferase family 2 protein, partial [Thermomicrobiales bacterium]|nr:glycosyltransferase family 2 protein [Thermomicrobiales bacterium]
PPEHAGEEVVVQFLLLNRYGGCGILPCGTYHLGLPTNVPDRRRNATELFDTLLERLDQGSTAPQPRSWQRLSPETPHV